MVTGGDPRDERDDDSDQDPERRDRELAKILARRVDRAVEDESSGSDGAPVSTADECIAGEIDTLDQLDELIADELAPEPVRLGDFRILREVGRGGMGRVYEAEQTLLGRRVALKVLSSGMLSDRTAVARFHREAKIAARLHHQQIVEVYAMGVEEGTPFFAMEYVEGQTLQQLLRGLRATARSPREVTLGDSTVRELLNVTRRFSPVSSPWDGIANETSLVATDRGSPGSLVAAVPTSDNNATERDSPPFHRVNTAYCVRIAEAFASVSEGLAHAHARGVVHRDLKPSNLILDLGGQLRILDFGLARVEGEKSLTLSRERLGTPSYMSPEQARGDGEKLGPSSDIYSLGTTLYEALAWRPAVEGRTYEETLELVVDRDPTGLRQVNPGVPRDLETIVAKCVRKKREDRYATAEALAQDLRRFVRGDPIEARPQPFHERCARALWRRRRRIAEAALIVLACVLLVVLVVLRREESREVELARYGAAVREAARSLYARALLGAVPRPASARSRPVALNSGSAVVDPEGIDAPVVADREADTLLVVEDALLASQSRVLVAGPYLRAAGARSQRAIADLRAAVASHPGLAPGRYHLARGLLAEGNVGEAALELGRALDGDSEFVPALSYLVSLVEEGSVPRAAADAAGLRRQLEALAADGWPRRWLAAKDAAAAGDWESSAWAHEELAAWMSSAGEPYAGAEVEEILESIIAELQAGNPDAALVRLSAAKSLGAAGVDLDVAEWRIRLLKGDRSGARRVARGIEAGAPGLGVDDVAAMALDLAKSGDPVAGLRWARALGEGAVRHRIDAEIHLGAKSDDAALRSAQAAVSAVVPADAGALLTLAEVLAARNEHDAAESVYREAVARSQGSEPEAVIALALHAELRQEPEAAEAMLRAVLERQSACAAAHYNLGRLLQARGENAAALESYLHAVSAEPRHAAALNNMGCLHDLEGRFDAAIAHYERAIAASPYYAVAHYNLGWAQHRVRRFDLAASEYRKAAQYGLGDDVELAAKTATCLHWQGEYDAALEKYNWALSRQPQRALLWEGLGSLYEWAHHWPASLERAGEMYARASALAPGWSAPRRDLARVLERRLHFETLDVAELPRLGAQVLAELEAAVAINPGDAEAQSLLAGILVRDRAPAPAGEGLLRAVRLLEAAALLENIGPAVRWRLDELRRAALPRVASPASVDWLFDEAVALVPGGSPHRFHRGRTEPSAGIEWTQVDADDAGWETGSGPIGYPAGGGATVVVDDMNGGYSSVYLRWRFPVDDPDRIVALRLRLRIDDGFVAYLNGGEAARFRAGEAGTILGASAVADELDGEPFVTVEQEVNPRLLRRGENVLAVQVINGALENNDAFADVILRAAVAGDAQRLAELGALQEAARGEKSGAGAGEDAATDLYFEARLLEMQGDQAAAAAKLEEAMRRDPGATVPALRLAAIWRGRGEPALAEDLLRGLLLATSPGDRRLWRAWTDVALRDLAWAPEAILQRMPATPRDGTHWPRIAANLRWALERLSAREPLRVLCGGGHDVVAGGVAWGRDRFSLAGEVMYLPRVAEHGFPGPLYVLERYFRHGGVVQHAYQVPLPDGSYRVTLHFIEGWHDAPGRRVFDVLLEDETVLARYDPCAAGVGVPDARGFDVVVGDGALDIDFRRCRDLPKLSGFEIERR